MDKLWYKLAGWTLIVVGVISGLFALLSFFGEFGGGPEPFLSVLILSISWIIGIISILLLFIIPGKIYLNVAKGKINENKLVKTSLIFIILSVIVLLLFALFVVFGLITGGEDVLEGAAWIFLIVVAWPLGILYGLSLLFLIINWFKNRNN